MTKVLPQKPFLLLLYGFPGSGKTYFARQFCEAIQAAHLEEDKIHNELFEKPSYTEQEKRTLLYLMEFMTTEFLKSGVSVVYDMNAMRRGHRRSLKELANSNGAKTLVVWIQLDAETAYLRNSKRDRRRLDDRYAAGYDFESFKQIASRMQPPENLENFIVISGKHSFPSQLSAIVKRLVDMQLIQASAMSRKIIKPELVNLVPSKTPKKNDKPGRHTIVLR
jgi:predicted kinase